MVGVEGLLLQRRSAYQSPSDRGESAGTVLLRWHTCRP